MATQSPHWGEEVTVHYRFHPLAGQRVACVGRRSLRGSPIVVVADAQGKRYHIPLWMTLPEAAEWGLREVPRLSLAALADLRDLLSAFLREPSPAGKEESHATPPPPRAAGAPVRAPAPDPPDAPRAAGRARGPGGADRGRAAPAGQGPAPGRPK